MPTIYILAGAVGTLASVAAMYVFIEITTAYWMPVRAGARWKALVEMPKLLHFAPVFRWMMPLFAGLAAFQLLLAVRLLLTGAGIG